MDTIASQIIFIFTLAALGFAGTNLLRMRKQLVRFAWPKLSWDLYRFSNFALFPCYFMLLTELNAVTIPLAVAGILCLPRALAQGAFALLEKGQSKRLNPLIGFIHSLALSLIIFGMLLYFGDIYRFIETLYVGSLIPAALLDAFYHWQDHKKAKGKKPISKRMRSSIIFHSGAILYTIMFCFIYLY